MTDHFKELISLWSSWPSKNVERETLLNLRVDYLKSIYDWNYKHCTGNRNNLYNTQLEFVESLAFLKYLDEIYIVREVNIERRNISSRPILNLRILKFVLPIRGSVEGIRNYSYESLLPNIKTEDLFSEKQMEARSTKIIRINADRLELVPSNEINQYKDYLKDMKWRKFVSNPIDNLINGDLVIINDYARNVSKRFISGKPLLSALKPPIPSPQYSFVGIYTGGTEEYIEVTPLFKNIFPQMITNEAIRIYSCSFDLIRKVGNDIRNNINSFVSRKNPLDRYNRLYNNTGLFPLPEILDKCIMLFSNEEITNSYTLTEDNSILINNKIIKILDLNSMISRKIFYLSNNETIDSNELLTNRDDNILQFFNLNDVYGYENKELMESRLIKKFEYIMNSENNKIFSRIGFNFKEFVYDLYYKYYAIDYSRNEYSTYNSKADPEFQIVSEPEFIRDLPEEPKEREEEVIEKNKEERKAGAEEIVHEVIVKDSPTPKTQYDSFVIRLFKDLELMKINLKNHEESLGDLIHLLESEGLLSKEVYNDLDIISTIPETPETPRGRFIPKTRRFSPSPPPPRRGLTPIPSPPSFSPTREVSPSPTRPEIIPPPGTPPQITPTPSPKKEISKKSPREELLRKIHIVDQQMEELINKYGISKAKELELYKQLKKRATELDTQLALLNREQKRVYGNNTSKLMDCLNEF